MTHGQLDPKAIQLSLLYTRVQRYARTIQAVRNTALMASFSDGECDRLAIYQESGLLSRNTSDTYLNELMRELRISRLTPLALKIVRDWDIVS